MKPPKTDFLHLRDLDAPTILRLFERARELKARRSAGEVETTLRGKTLILLFEKASTRTRLSFEAAIFQLGGHAITLPWGESQAARGEPLADTARVTGSYGDAIVFRTFGEERLFEVARHARVPVINALTDEGHPVQVLTDLFTIWEHFGSLDGKVITWVGDGASNMARSWLEAAELFPIELRVAAPEGFEPPAAAGSAAQATAAGSVRILRSPAEAVAGADVICTDVWTSMGQEEEGAARREALRGYTVDEALVAGAAQGAIVLHCLPAKRGEEITAGVMDGPQSLIWEQAENRLHVQKALLELLLLPHS